jgi:hypothetical protein
MAMFSKQPRRSLRAKDTWMFDQAFETDPTISQPDMVELLENEWKRGRLDAPWYRLVLAVGLTEYPFHDYGAALPVMHALYASRYRSQAAMLGAHIYQCYPVDTSFVAILAELHSPCGHAALAAYYRTEQQSALMLHHARRSLAHKPIPDSLEILIRYDASLDQEERTRMIELWDGLVGANDHIYHGRLNRSLQLYHDYWFEWILGAYRVDSVKQHFLEQFRSIAAGQAMSDL